MMTTLITGVAGFIGFHVALSLISSGKRVVGVDNINDYYDVVLKKDRLEILRESPLFSFHKGSIEDQIVVENIIKKNADIVCVIHMAAQAGVRYSVENPYVYETSNLRGVLTVLEQLKHLKSLEHFIFASSSSVYGGETRLPYRVEYATDTPLSFYAATKKSGESICYSYSHLYKFPVTCLRFFTVYGPWGRPDMAAHIFIESILSGIPINVFNDGNMRRDFTFISDIVTGVLGCIDKPPKIKTGEAPFAVYNLGNNRSENLMDFIKIIENEVGRKADINFRPMRKEDVPETCAYIEDAKKDFGFNPKVNISEGIPKCVQWFRDYYSK